MKHRITTRTSTASQETMNLRIGAAEREGIVKRKYARLRPHVMSAYLASHDTYAELYKKLAQ